MPDFNDTRLWSTNNTEYRRIHSDWFKTNLCQSEGEDSNPMRMIIEPPTFNTTKIGTVTLPEVKKFEFRPQSWEQFIGQPQAKDRVKTIVAQAQKGMRSHLILSAIRGHGKTSYIKLLSKTLDANLIERIGNTVTLETLPDIINEINSSDKLSVLFIDEIDTMPKEIIKVLNPIIESFEISGKQIKPFIFACATINKFLLYKNNPDFLDRIQHHINFTRYSVEELTQIINQVHYQLYNDVKISCEQLTILAKNSKFNPRTAINLLEYFVVDQNLASILKTCCIVKDGLTETDVKILQFLASSLKPVGANAIAMKVGMSQNEYINEYESFLFEFGYINRLPSRTISEKGKEFLTSIK